MTYRVITSADLPVKFPVTETVVAFMALTIWHPPVWLIVIATLFMVAWWCRSIMLWMKQESIEIINNYDYLRGSYIKLRNRQHKLLTEQLIVRLQRNSTVKGSAMSEQVREFHSGLQQAQKVQSQTTKVKSQLEQLLTELQPASPADDINFKIANVFNEVETLSKMAMQTPKAATV